MEKNSDIQDGRHHIVFQWRIKIEKYDSHKVWHGFNYESARVLINSDKTVAAAVVIPPNESKGFFSETLNFLTCQKIVKRGLVFIWAFFLLTT